MNTTMTLYFTNPGQTLNFRTYETASEAKQAAVAANKKHDVRVRLRLRHDDTFDLIIKEPRQVEVRAKSE